MLFKIDPKASLIEEIEGKKRIIIKKDEFGKFNPAVLGLGDISLKSKMVSSVCAIFDLAGFTDFTKQADPQLVVPVFLNQYLNWFFGEIRNETSEKETAQGFTIYHDFPVLTKFMGDGLLLVWDTSTMGETSQNNLPISLNNICKKYVSDFLPKISKKVSDAPKKLRCGVAKGNIFSVGDGNDFVGPCINLAARLQKLPGLTFAFSSKGFSVEDQWSPATKATLTLKKTEIRGIGKSELIYVRKIEIDALPAKEKKLYLEP